jgi:hypothetical protein
MPTDRKVGAMLASSGHLGAAHLVVLTITNTGDPDQEVVGEAGPGKGGGTDARPNGRAAHRATAGVSAAVVSCCCSVAISTLNWSSESNRGSRYERAPRRPRLTRHPNAAARSSWARSRADIRLRSPPRFQALSESRRSWPDCMSCSTIRNLLNGRTPIGLVTGGLGGHYPPGPLCWLLGAAAAIAGEGGLGLRLPVATSKSNYAWNNRLMQATVD